MALAIKESALSVVGLRFRTRLTDDRVKESFQTSITLQRGMTLIVVGPVGCGKSDAALCIAGLNDSKEDDVRVCIGEDDLAALTSLRRAERIALVPSNPSLVFSCISKSVVREIEFSCEFLGRNADSTEVQDLLKQLELDSLSLRDPLTLSGGEKIRAAIAVALAKGPHILVVDQVFEELDSVSERLVRHALNQERQTKGLILIEFHSGAPDCTKDKDQQWLFVTSTGLVQGSFVECWQKVSEFAPELLPKFPSIGARLQRQYGISYAAPPISASLVAEPFVRRPDIDLSDAPPDVSSAAITVRELEFAYSGLGSFRFGPINHSFPTGRATAVLGRNGAGKTTLLRCLGNLNQGWKGEVSLGANGPSKADPLHFWARHSLYCFQNPDDQIFFTTVHEELVETARRIREPKFPVENEVQRVASALGLSSLLKTAPFDLPRAFRRLVTLGSALVASPRVLLLDEPTGGLDGQLTQRLVGLLREYLNGGGTAVVVSHDYDFVAEIADDILVLDGGVIKTVGTREAGFQSWPGESTPTVISVAMQLGLPRATWREKEFLQSIAVKQRT